MNVRQTKDMRYPLQRSGSFQPPILSRNKSFKRQEVTYQTLVSHALSDYTKCFRPYVSADILIYDTDNTTLEELRAKLGRIVVVGKEHTDRGRNATVNVCNNFENLMHRLFTCNETYALLIISDNDFTQDSTSQGIGGIVRANGYQHTMGLVCGTCTITTSYKCRMVGYDVCLVRHTGTIEGGVTAVLSAVAIRHPDKQALTKK